MAAVGILRKRHGDIEAILFECAGLSNAAQDVRDQTERVDGATPLGLMRLCCLDLSMGVR